MHRVRVRMPVVITFALAGAVAVPAQAAPSPSRAGLTYSDPAFTFVYPNGWTSISPAVMQQATSSFASVKQEMHVTDAGGVSTGRGPSVAAAIVVIRFRLTRTARLQVEKNRSAFVRSFFNGVALAARRILHRGPTTIGGHQANEIELMQGSGTVRLHQRIYILLSSDAKRTYLVYFITPKRDWSRYLPSFYVAVTSMRFSPSP